VRCRECVGLSHRERGGATREQIRNAALAALAAGAAGGLALGLLSFVNLLTALALGFAVGSAALIASGRHRGVAIQGIAGAVSLVGILFAIVLASLGDRGGAQEIARVLVNIPYSRFVTSALGGVAGAIIRFLI
jgi:hypothetical protein